MQLLRVDICRHARPGEEKEGDMKMSDEVIYYIVISFLVSLAVMLWSENRKKK
jgi:hypothetical protein